LPTKEKTLSLNWSRWKNSKSIIKKGYG